MEEVLRWKNAEHDRWESIWSSHCREFVLAFKVKELRRLIVEYLLRLCYNEWDTLGFDDEGRFKRCCLTSSDKGWSQVSFKSMRFSSPVDRITSTMLLNHNGSSMLVGKYSCAQTANRMLISVMPANKASYTLSFWNQRTHQKWLIYDQHITHLFGTRTPGIYFALAPASQYHYRSFGVHNIDLRLNNSTDTQTDDLTMQAIVQFANCEEMRVQMTFSGERNWDDLYLIIELQGLLFDATTFSFDYSMA